MINRRKLIGHKVEEVKVGVLRLHWCDLSGTARYEDNIRVMRQYPEAYRDYLRMVPKGVDEMTLFGKTSLVEVRGGFFVLNAFHADSLDATLLCLQQAVAHCAVIRISRGFIPELQIPHLSAMDTELFRSLVGYAIETPAANGDLAVYLIR